MQVSLGVLILKIPIRVFGMINKLKYLKLQKSVLISRLLQYISELWNAHQRFPINYSKNLSGAESTPPRLGKGKVVAWLTNYWIYYISTDVN